MKLPTLDEFIARARKKFPHNSWVREPGFAELYVRVSSRYLEGKLLPTIDLANIAASRPGSGAFTKLVTRLQKKYPEFGLYVESVLTERFAKGLKEKWGFKQHRDEWSFYLLPKKWSDCG